jgi:hypothetical protein
MVDLVKMGSASAAERDRSPGFFYFPKGPVITFVTFRRVPGRGAIGGLVTHGFGAPAPEISTR